MTSAGTIVARTPSQKTPPLFRLWLHQLRYEVRASQRNPLLFVFTLGLPLTMLTVFSALLGDQKFGAIGIRYKQYFMPNVLMLAIFSSCFAVLGSAIAVRRGTGEFKRLRGTPMPPGVALAALAAHAAMLGLAVVVVLLAFGRVALGVALPRLVPFAVVLAVAIPSAAVLGVAIASVIKRPQNAPAVTNFLLWPVAFVSGTFSYVPDGSPIKRIADVLPLQHLNDAATAASRFGGRQLEWSDLAVVLVWAAVGAVVALRRLRWTQA